MKRNKNFDKMEGGDLCLNYNDVDMDEIFEFVEKDALDATLENVLRILWNKEVQWNLPKADTV